MLYNVNGCGNYRYESNILRFDDWRIYDLRTGTNKTIDRVDGDERSAMRRCRELDLKDRNAPRYSVSGWFHGDPFDDSDKYAVYDELSDNNPYEPVSIHNDFGTAKEAARSLNEGGKKKEKPLKEYKKFLRQLHELERQGKADSLEYNAIVEAMDAPWKKMSGKEREEGADYSVLLWEKHDKESSDA